MDPELILIQEETLDSDHASSSFVASSNPRPTVHCPTLTSFLGQLNLSQYHSPFVDAGVGENDVEQLLDFDETSLKEVTDAIPMKIFHSIVFKKGIRELRRK